jgi:5-methylcytosine-specific restriction endonuclease McrA
MNQNRVSRHEDLHEKALSRAKAFHRAEAELLDILQELDSAKTFLHYRCTSLYDYCLKYLKLSEANTASFIRVSRKSDEVPELKEAIRKQEITISKAQRIASVMTKENSDHWLELAKTLPKSQLEKEVAKVAPKEATPEKAKYVSEDRININMGVSENCMQKFRRVQDLVSQKNRKHSSLEESLEVLLEFYLQRNDPVAKAQRNVISETAAGNQSATVPGHSNSQKPLLAQTKHQVNLRDQGQCTFVSDGNRCENQRWIEFHHVVPRSKGGSNNLENLVTLCSAHHRMQH